MNFFRMYFAVGGKYTSTTGAVNILMAVACFAYIFAKHGFTGAFDSGHAEVLFIPAGILVAGLQGLFSNDFMARFRTKPASQVTPDTNVVVTDKPASNEPEQGV